MARKKKTANGINPTPSNTVDTTEPPKENGALEATDSNQITAIRQLPKIEWFTAMLYPDDPKHESMKRYLESRVPQYAWILHDLDLVTQHDVDKHPWDEKTQSGYKPEYIGSLKKPHWHVCWNHWSRVRLQTVRDLFSCWCKQNLINACTDRVSYIYYWTHDDPKSQFLEKTPYSWDDITIKGAGLNKEIQQIKQNVDFIQFEEHYRISELITSANAYTLTDVYRLFAENRVCTTLSCYEITQIVRDLQFLRKDTAWKKLDEAERINVMLYQKLHNVLDIIEDPDKRENIERLIYSLEKNTTN